MRLTRLFCTIATALVCASPAHAVLIGYEGFAGYTTGSSLNGLSGTGSLGFEAGSSWTGTGPTVQAASLSYTNGGTLLTSGGSLLSSQFGNNIRPLAAPIATTTTSGEEFWMAYLFKSGSNLEDGNLVRFYNEASSGGQDGARIDLNVTRGWPDTTKQFVRMGIFYNDGGGTEGGDTLFKPAGEDNLLVMQYKLDDINVDGNQGEMRAWVNPVIGGAPPTPATAASSILTNIGGFDGPDMLRLWSPGGGAWAVTRDEIRWGTTFADVTPVVTAVLGDYDGNQTVATPDYNKWKAEFNTAGTLSNHTATPFIVDAADYTVWRDNLPSGGAVAGAAAVPEPTALFLLAIGGGLLGWCNRRTR